MTTTARIRGAIRTGHEHQAGYCKAFPGIVNLLRFNVYDRDVLDSLDPAVYYPAVNAWRILIQDYGFGHSSKGACLDREGNPIPGITTPRSSSWESYPLRTRAFLNTVPATPRFGGPDVLSRYNRSKTMASGLPMYARVFQPTPISYWPTMRAEKIISARFRGADSSM